VLDVGCAGRFHPFELWEPVLPFADQIELVGIDVAHLEPTRLRAGELGFPLELRSVSALELVQAFGPDRFDVVVSTQVLEHIRDWPAALRGMRDVLRPGGTLLVTCDSGDHARPLLDRARLSGKRVYARMAESVPLLASAGRRLASADWESGPARHEIEHVVDELGLACDRVAWYGLRDIKAAQQPGGSAARLLWLALEEALEAEAGSAHRPELYQILYLRARKP
jgi:SAM-dependent methyltransferase